MIDSNSETLLSLTQAAKILPRRRGNRPVHVSCMFRWTTSGCKGVILESIQIGGTRCTSKEALARFFECLTEATKAGRQSIPTPQSARMTATRRKAIEAAEKELAAAGI
jgi:hypothetical protein